MTSRLQRSSDTITVVTGLPRSGTSLMMQMLEAGGVPILCDAVRRPDESNPRGYYELEAVKHTGRDAGWLDDAPGRAVKVIHALIRHLPRDRPYRVLLMERDIEEVIDSQEAMLERLGRPLSGLPRERMADVFLRQLDEARSLLAAETCFDTLAVSYAELIRSQTKAVVPIEAFLELPGTSDSMAACIDASLHRSRRD